MSELWAHDNILKSSFMQVKQAHFNNKLHTYKCAHTIADKTHLSHSDLPVLDASPTLVNVLHWIQKIARNKKETF